MRKAKLFRVEEPIVFYKSSERMEEINNNTIQLIITSPPYGKIKDYGDTNQIGFADSFEDYFQRLKNVWKECYRVLEPQCRMIINVGDQYLRTVEFGRYRILSIASRIISDCQDLGFDFLGDLIWQKVSTTNTTGGCSLMGSIYYPRNGLLTFDYEHILIFKKHEGKDRKLDVKIKELSKISLSEWKKWYVGHWRIPGVIQKEHIAMFPEEIPYRLIRMFSFIGDTVLDPFLGSGTTLKVARALFRKGIGYEINQNFSEIINKKIKDGKIGYFQDYQFLIYQIFQKLQQENIEIAYVKQRQKGVIILRNNEGQEIILDYLLIDSEDFDKKEILKQLNSKIGENPVNNFLNNRENWINFSKYIIIVNTNFSAPDEMKNLIYSFIKSNNLSDKVRFISFNQILSKQFNLSSLFSEIDLIFALF